jgi:glutamate-1-semialdehyde 2,1-aminomutase
MVKALHPLVREYQDWSPRSARLMDRGRRVFPGGDTRASAHYGPYPLVMERGEGCRLFDVDGHEFLDFMNNFTSLIHGHAHAATVAAVTRQVPRGSAYAAPSTSQIELAELIVSRVPSIEQMRFCSSGTEATLMALRCARAVTGRQKIMKMEGGYHGSYELAEVSLIPSPDQRGDLDHPNSIPVDKSFPASVLKDTVVCPYNEPDLARALIDEHAGDLAAVIVEPILGSMGMIPASLEFLTALREETRKNNIVLIFDEVISLRLSSAGGQGRTGVSPDLTCMGKIIGGGLPVGAIGGRQDLMQVFNPEAQDTVFHASTFSGNALTMASGLATMSDFDDKDSDRINRLGEQLRSGFNGTLSQHGVRGQAIGSGSLSNIILSDEPLHDARDSMQGMAAGGHVNALLHLCMLRKGIVSAARLMYCVSTPMDETHIDTVVTALSDSLTELRPYIEAERPGLLI